MARDPGEHAHDDGSASDLKESEVVIYPIKANILLCPLNAVSVAAEIDCCEAILGFAGVHYL